MLACFSFFGPCLVPPWASAGPSFTSSNVFCHLGGAIAGSWVPFCSSFEAICCSRAPFLASTWHLFGRFRGQFDVHQFFPCTTFKQGTDQLPVMITVKVAHHQVKVSCTYASRNALLTAHAALTSSLYITSLASLRGVRTSGSPMRVTSPFWPLGRLSGAYLGLQSAPRASFLCIQ